MSVAATGEAARSLAAILAVVASATAACTIPSRTQLPRMSASNSAAAGSSDPQDVAPGAAPEASPEEPSAARADGGEWTCPVRARWSLRLRHDRPQYEAEWRQCAKAFHDPVGDWDIDALAVHDPGGHGFVVWSTTNAGEPTERWLEDARPTHFGSRGEEQLLVLTRIAGTGHAWELCVLGAVADGVGCWALPDKDIDERFERLLSRGEWAHNCQVGLSASGLKYTCGVARPGDPNCCPTGGILHASATPADGSFVVNRVWRTAQE